MQSFPLEIYCTAGAVIVNEWLSYRNRENKTGFTLCTYRCIAPLPPPLGHMWGYSGDLTQPNVKCPIVGQTYRVKSPLLAPVATRDLTKRRKLQQKIFGCLLNDRQMRHSGAAVSCQFPL